jgi:hypothetical protein
MTLDESEKAIHELTRNNTNRSVREFWCDLVDQNWLRQQPAGQISMTWKITKQSSFAQRPRLAASRLQSCGGVLCACSSLQLRCWRSRLSIACASQANCASALTLLTEEI